MCGKDGTRSVLVVDDDAGIRESLVDILSLEGYRVMTAQNGAEAVAALRAGVTPCLILLDLKMPVMSGAEFYALQQADSAWSQIPVVIISADGDVATKAAALGCAKFIEKPMKVPTILTCVERHCGHAGAARRPRRRPRAPLNLRQAVGDRIVCAHSRRRLQDHQARNRCAPMRRCRKSCVLPARIVATFNGVNPVFDSRPGESNGNTCTRHRRASWTAPIQRSCKLQSGASRSTYLIADAWRGHRRKIVLSHRVGFLEKVGLALVILRQGCRLVACR